MSLRHLPFPPVETQYQASSEFAAHAQVSAGFAISKLPEPVIAVAQQVQEGRGTLWSRQAHHQQPMSRL